VRVPLGKEEDKLRIHLGIEEEKLRTHLGIEEDKVTTHVSIDEDLVRKDTFCYRGLSLYNEGRNLNKCEHISLENLPICECELNTNGLK
jgi:hypothetical protein